MKLSSAIFYQAVKLWDGNLYGTVLDGENGRMKGISIELKDHLITLTKTGESWGVIVGTANLRNGCFEIEKPIVEKVVTKKK